MVSSYRNVVMTRGKKKPAKSKHLSVSNSGKGGHVYTKLTSKDDSDSESNSSDGDEEDSTNLTAHLLDKDGGATGGSEGVHTKVDSDQEELGFVDVIGGLPYQLIIISRTNSIVDPRSPD
ncbi:hypothetical protein BASA60_000968 [Batrachochytrium salamandrivorans]|nr:hypothetical protein BASA60_000968 [Batrachochytrium salamandrivorans]